MLEWLGADPINGVVTTINFFIFLMIGRYLRMKKSSLEKVRISVYPRIKVLFVLLLIISITIMDRWYFPTGISVICILISLRYKIFHEYIKRLIFPLVLAVFIVITQGLTYGSNKIDYGIIQIYPEGLNSGFMIFARVMAASSLAILLLLNTTEYEIIDTMRMCRVPGTILDISSLMGRYIRVFSMEARKIKWAQESRCGLSRKSGFHEKMHDTASIAGLLIGRAVIRAEHVNRAMLSRGWKPEKGSISGMKK